MQFPESWLRTFCDPPLSTQALADTLTMAGMEVEALAPVAPPFHGVVVGHVMELQRHPNADRLNVCRVDIGGGEPLTIVCGAPNVRAGLKVPCAVVGAELPPSDPAKGPFRITLSTLRGVESQGMLCSARELGLPDDQGGLLVLAEDAPVGVDLRAHLALDDTLFTLKLTPNLGHCLSVRGVARELSALTGAPLRDVPPLPVLPTHGETLPIRIEAADLCGRFSGRLVRGIDPAAKTPAWMLERLARCGQRSVSALVDISNYVMFELGQPTHIFDLRKLEGGLTVRWGRAGETLKLLNGQTAAVDTQVGVIADAVAVESLAGIMGGDATAVSDTTRDVYVEAAFWWPDAVAGRARRYNFATDAGHRFERGVDPSGTVDALERITRLIVDICGGAPGPVDDQVVRLPHNAPVTLRIDRAARIIGMPVDQAQCAGVMRRLGFAITEGDGRIDVVPPPWRFDLRLEEDLIEEVIRVLGYASLPSTPPSGPLLPRVTPERRRRTRAVRHALAALGYSETINFSFVGEAGEHGLAGNPHPIRVLNPIASGLNVMRSTLIGGLLQVLSGNLARKTGRVRVFEIGRVFTRDDAVADGPLAVAGVRQPLHVAGLAYGSAEPVQWGAAERRVDFFDVKGDVQALLHPLEPVFVAAGHPALHPGRSARVELDGRSVGWIGELHPRWRQQHDLPQPPVVFELELDAALQRPLPVFAPLPRQQSVWRDIALVVDGAVSHAALMSAIGDAADGVVQQAVLFDIYRPSEAGAELASNQRRWAVRLELRDDTATLTDQRIEQAVQRVLASVAAGVGARLRTT